MVDNIRSERFKQIRKRLGMNQEDFAKALALTQSGVSFIEKGGGLSIETLQKLKDVYNVNVEWVLTGEGEMFRLESSKLSNRPADNGQYGQVVTDMLKDQLKRAYEEIEFLREIIRKADLGKLEEQLFQTALEDLPFIFAQEGSNAVAPITELR